MSHKYFRLKLHIGVLSLGSINSKTETHNPVYSGYFHMLSHYSDVKICGNK